MEQSVDNMMVRQQSLPLVIPKKVCVVGCGGVGSWAAYLLALAGVPEIWIFEHDTVDETNLNRIPLPLSAIGQNKGKAIAALIESVRPKCIVLAMGKLSQEVYQEMNLYREGFDWIICTTDSLASRQMARSLAANSYRKNDAGKSIDCTKYIEASAEGDFGGCTGEPADWSTPDELNPGYASVPVWVGPAIAAAYSACNYVLHDQHPKDDNVRLGWEEGPDEFGNRRGVFTAQIHTDHLIVEEVDDEDEALTPEEQGIHTTSGGDWSTLPTQEGDANGDDRN